MKKNQIKNSIYIALSISITLSLILFCSRCKVKEEGIPIVVFDSTKIDFEIRIHDWQIIGPFIDDKTNISNGSENQDYLGYHYDYLKNFGFSETNISTSNLLSIEKSKSTHPNLVTDEFINKTIRDTCKDIIFSKYFRTINNSAVYAFFEIYSSREQDVVFITGSDDGMKAWLNNKIIVNKTLARSLSEFQDITICKLKKGKNLFSAKVYNITKEWGLNVRILSISQARKILMKKNILTMFEKSIYKNTDSLKLNIILFPSDSQNAEAAIYDCFGNKVIVKDFKKKDYLNIAISNFHKGIYRAKVNIDAENFEQWFYYGSNSDSLLASYIERSRKYNDDTTKTNLHALLIRYEHLVSAENKKLDDPDWQKKIIFVIKELELSLYDLECGKQAFKNKLGQHIRGYCSKIDNQEQFYRIYVPSQYNEKKPSALVIIVPPITAPIRPFLKSIHLANLLPAEDYYRASEKYGNIILWTNNRGYNYGNPIETSDLLEAFEAIKKDYNIDEDRVYLLGNCSGGLTALILGMRYPSQFAAIGLFSPLTNQTKIAESHLGISYLDCEFWLKQNTPILNVNNFKNVPIYILHGDKNHAPVEQSLNFMAECKKEGIKPYFEISYDEIEPGISSTNYNAFDFFKEKIRNKNPKIVDYSITQLKYNKAYWITIYGMNNIFKKATIHADHTKPDVINVETENVSRYEIQITDMGIDRNKPIMVITNGKISFNGLTNDSIISVIVTNNTVPISTLTKNQNTEGPIMHAFSGGFIVADCENPTLSIKTEMSTVCDSLLKAWKRNYFVEGFRYKKASEINQEDIKKYNLVLLGNPENNILIKKIINQIPVKFNPNSITLANKVFMGGNIDFLIIYPNPLNAKNYVVLCGSNNWPEFRLPAMNLSMEGLYDFVIWETLPDGKRNILDIGYFDSSWQKVISMHNL